jgi:hypothetical protein
MSVPDSLLFQVETNTQQISSLDERLNTVEFEAQMAMNVAHEALANAEMAMEISHEGQMAMDVAHEALANAEMAMEIAGASPAPPAPPPGAPPTSAPLSPVNMGSTIIKNGPWRKTLYGTTGNPNSELQFPPEVHAGGNEVKKAYCESITNPNSQNAIPSPDGNNYVGFSWHPAWGGGGCQLFTSEAINNDGQPDTQVAAGWTTVYFPAANIEPFTGDIYNTVRSNSKLFYFLVICLLIFVFYLVNKKRFKKLIKKMIKK